MIRRRLLQSGAVKVGILEEAVVRKEKYLQTMSVAVRKRCLQTGAARKEGILKIALIAINGKGEMYATSKCSSETMKSSANKQQRNSSVAVVK